MIYSIKVITHKGGEVSISGATQDFLSSFLDWFQNQSGPCYILNVGVSTTSSRPVDDDGLVSYSPTAATFAAHSVRRIEVEQNTDSIDGE